MDLPPKERHAIRFEMGEPGGLPDWAGAMLWLDIEVCDRPKLLDEVADRLVEEFPVRADAGVERAVDALAWLGLQEMVQRSLERDRQA